MSFIAASKTHAGGRVQNQDAIREIEVNGHFCWVIADGLGGHADGARAATLACEAFVAGFARFAECSPEAMLTYIFMANQAVCRANRELAPGEDGTDGSARKERGMASTLAAVIATGGEFVTGHCGDSRIYHLRRGALFSQTRDHSLVQAMVEAGDLSPREMATHPDRNRLLRCLGEKDDVQPETSAWPIPVKPGDAFLLATDGFWEHVSGREIEAELAKAATPEDWLEGLAIRIRRRILNAATKTASGADNYSAIAIWAEEEAMLQ